MVAFEEVETESLGNYFRQREFNKSERCRTGLTIYWQVLLLFGWSMRYMYLENRNAKTSLLNLRSNGELIKLFFFQGGNRIQIVP